jgi:hypothetical protein
MEALALARSGQLQDARRMAALAVQIAQKSGRRERAGLFEAGTAVWEAFHGNAAAARQRATRALEQERDCFDLVGEGSIGEHRAPERRVGIAGQLQQVSGGRGL